MLIHSQLHYYVSQILNVNIANRKFRVVDKQKMATNAIRWIIQVVGDLLSSFDTI